MATLSQVHVSNAQIPTTLPPNLVAVFVGATSGIGEAALKEFIRNARSPKCYLVGRSEQAANRIIDECNALNPDASVVFMRADMSLVKEADRLSERIISVESVVDVLFLSAGTVIFDRSETSEGLHTLAALTFYTRLRITQRLLPLLQNSTSLSRVINIAGGTKEGTLYADDFQALTIPFYAIRGHLATLITLGHEALAARAPMVSFLHVFPGAVKTALFDRMPGVRGFAMRCLLGLVGRWIYVPIQESGERNVFFAMSGAFPGRDNGAGKGVGLVEGLSVARGVDGRVGSGVYSVDYDGTEAGDGIVGLLEGYRGEGMVERVWEHAMGEFERITRSLGSEG